MDQAQNPDWSPRPLPDCLSTILGPGQAVHLKRQEKQEKVFVRHSEKLTGISEISTLIKFTTH